MPDPITRLPLTVVATATGHQTDGVLVGVAVAELDALEASVGQVPDDSLLVYRDLLEAFVDDEDCHFDHHGGCQAHGYLSLEPGQVCPQEELKLILHVGGR